ncbi:MAG: TolC family protein, partial [Pseudomonadota bacterium]|nr:TolC family protein [Pseudomonadota bacterium]
MLLRSLDTARPAIPAPALIHRICLQWHRAGRAAALLYTLCAPTALLAQPPEPVTLTLQQAIATAAAHNHDLRLGTLAVQNAEAAGLTAAAAPNPTLTLQTFNINPSAGIGAGGLREKTVDSTVRIDQVIERGGKRALRVASAAELESAARHDLRDAARQLRINVTQAYYDLLAAQEKRVITQDTAMLFAHSVAAAQKRQRAGDLATADVARLQIDALRANNDEVQSQADLDKAQLALALLLGDPRLASSLHLTDEWPTPRFDDPAPAA